MVLILIQSDISFYSFYSFVLCILPFGAVPGPKPSNNPGLTFNWLLIFSRSIKRISKFYEVKKLQNQFVLIEIS